MAFWGIEIKPGKSFTHCCGKSKGRLRISQATLGIGDATHKGIVQCNVGKRRPVLLCALLPNKTESCHLDFEFEEADDVVFSVIGPQSVYLTGYYLQKHRQSNPHSDTESYGVDIENTQTEGSSFCSDDDKYEDSFIDDVKLQVPPLASVLSLKVDDTMLEKETPNDRKCRCKQHKMRNQEIESDRDETHKTEDEHGGYLLSVSKSRSGLETTISDDAENIAQVLVEMGEKAEDSGNYGNKSTEKVDPNISGKPERETKMGLDDKEWVEIEKNGPKKVQTPEKIVDNYEKSLADDKFDGNKGEATIIKQSLPMSNEEDCGQSLDFYNTKPKRKRRKHSLQEEKNCEFEIDIDQSVRRVEKAQEVESSSNFQPKNKIKKKGRKKAQGKGDMDMDMMKMKSNQENVIMEYEDLTENATQAKRMTLSNGLIIEELAHGPPGGKIAAVGKKIKVFYTAMLKESGKVFDSNMGGNVCSCRLGDEDFIDGWSVGIDGMHVGDKRRLIIPPSMGFGSYGVGEDVPPNSWLVYDIELVHVR